MSYKHKRSDVPGKVPVAADFKDGEILVNTADGRAFINTPGGVKTLPNTEDTSAFLPLTGGTLTGELITTAVNSFRMAYGGKSTFWRQDGNTQYLMISDTPTGTYNDLRPFAVNLTSGRVSLGNGLTVTGGITGTASWANGANYADRLGPGGWTLADVQGQLNWRVTDTRFSGYTAGALDVRSNVDVGLSVGASGYVLTGVSKSANHMSFQFRQPQIHIPNVGWRALGSW